MALFSPPSINGAATLRHRLDYLAVFVLVLCAGYVATLVWVDHGNGTFSRLSEVWQLMSLAIVPVSITYLFRYWRWQWLLRRKGHRVPVLPGLASYLAGFALTATPGKAGELMRIRYFARMGVPAERTLGVFVFERASDLLVILALSLLAAAGRSQDSSATHDLKAAISASIASLGVFQPSVWRGRVFISKAM